MIFEYRGFSKVGGIYQIKNILSGILYIGSTVKFYDRWTDHSRSLKAQKHKTKHLQNSYNKYFSEYNSDDFLEFSILEVMENSTKEERLIKEEWWINKFLEQGIELYNTNKRPTKEPIVQSVMSMAAKQKMIERRKGKRISIATEYKPGNVPWTKQNGHDEETKKLISEKSKEMWANPEIAEKLLKSRRSEKFRKCRSKNMKESWENTREQRLAAMNTPECIEAKTAWMKNNKEARKKMIEKSHSIESLKKRLITIIGQEKAEKLLDADWLRTHVKMYGFNGTARVVGVDRGTVERWYKKLC